MLRQDEALGDVALALADTRKPMRAILESGEQGCQPFKSWFLSLLFTKIYPELYTKGDLFLFTTPFSDLTLSYTMNKQGLLLPHADTNAYHLVDGEGDRTPADSSIAGDTCPADVSKIC